jgi:prepilin-type N-terminal cleavage/methylation domain-containing protein
MQTRTGFTLIELLIVVAIIAILALIAVPNFLEAQVRSKVSRTHTDLRSIAVALEAYRVDWEEYPYKTGEINDSDGLIRLSTPVAYMSNPILIDPFKTPREMNSDRYNVVTYVYLPFAGPRADSWCRSKFGNPGSFALVSGHDMKTGYPGPYRWILLGYGPDRVFQFDNDPAIRPLIRGVTGNIYMPYDPTNGTVSWGDIHRLGP